MPNIIIPQYFVLLVNFLVSQVLPKTKNSKALGLISKEHKRSSLKRLDLDLQKPYVLPTWQLKYIYILPMVDELWGNLCWIFSVCA